MNFAMWILAGGALGWIGFIYLRANEDRGIFISVVIGVVGGFLGGNVLAPILGAPTETPNDFSMYSLVIATASAAAFLFIGNLASKRFGV